MRYEFERAREAVEEHLKVKEFIENHEQDIYEKLEKFEESASVASREDEHAFIAESLPLIEGIVQVGSTPKDFEKASGWLKGLLPQADPALALSALVLMYVVGRGHQRFSIQGSSAQRASWERMFKRVQALQRKAG